MYFQSISLAQFRNYDSLQLEFSPAGNVFFASNGQGKTNLLEAIYCLCVGKSARSGRDVELVKQQCNFYRLLGVCYRENGSRLGVELTYEKPNRKSLKINGQSRKVVSELIGKLSVVSFSPGDIAITSAGPQYRRRFLDIALSQTRRIYLLNLQEYQRILEQRNSILKKIRTETCNKKYLQDQLTIWNHQLATVGSQLVLYRLKAVEFFNKIAHRIHKRISESAEDLYCKYSISFSYDNLDHLVDHFYQALTSSQARDEVRGFTTIGPHRDDLHFTLNELDLRTYGSQGQHRTACISLRIAEAEWIASEIEEKPILLLDEVFAELDLHRTNQLMNLFQGYGQVFIVTAREEDLSKCPKSFARFHIKNGKVSSCEN